MDPDVGLHDAELVGRIQAGDLEAEARLVESFGRKLTFLLARWTGSREAARDLCQETLRLALEKVRQGKVQQPGKLPAFLHGVARNLAARHLQAEHRWRERHLELDAASEVQGDAAGGQLARLLGRERAELVHQVLSALPKSRDREVLGRYYLTDQPKAQICAELGVDEAHFKRVLFRARERYRILFEQRSHGLDAG